MAQTRTIRPPFDARHKFVVTPPAGRSTLPVGGKLLPVGAPFDLGLVDPRRLRQMYEARLLAVAPGSVLPRTSPARPRAIGPNADAAPAAASAPSAPASRAPRRQPTRRMLTRAA